MFAAERSGALKQTLSVWLAVMAFAFVTSIAAASLVFFSFLVFYLVVGRKAYPRAQGSWTPIEKAFLLFWGISLMSAAVTGFTSSSRTRLSKDLYIVILPLLTLILQSDRTQAQRWMRWMLIGGLITAAFGLLQYAVGINRPDTKSPFENVPALLTHWPRAILAQLTLRDGRVTGLRGHPLTFAETLLFPLAYLLSQLAIHERVRWKTWLPAFGLLIVALLLSQSRGPWMAFAGMAIAAIALRPRRPFIRRLAVLLLLPIGLIVLHPALRSRLASIADTGFHSNAERVAMWQVGVRMIKDHPFFGIGPGNVKRVSPQYQSAELFQRHGAWGHLHNTYINMAADRGLLGLAAFTVFFGMILARLLRAHRAQGGEAERVLVMTALLGCVGWLISGVTETIYHNSSILMLFYFVVGSALGVSNFRHPPRS